MEHMHCAGFLLLKKKVHQQKLMFFILVLMFLFDLFELGQMFLVF